MSFLNVDDINLLKVCDCNFETTTGDTTGTLSDSRMYPSIADRVCPTCNTHRQTCVGHFGRSVLPIPVITPMTSIQLINVLNSVCSTCGELFLDETYLESEGILHLNGFKRLAAIAAATVPSKSINSRRPCRSGRPECSRVYTYSMPSSSSKATTWYIMRQHGKEAATEYPLIKILPILRLLDTNTERLKLLGLFPQSDEKGTLASSLLIQHILIMPENNRPDMVIGGVMQVNHATARYKSIIKVSRELQSKSPDSPEYSKLATKQANEIHALIFGNIKVQMAQNEGTGAIKEMLTAKNGIIRSNMMGHRNDHTGRSVLGPGGAPFGYMEIPKEMDGLTFRERVYSRNIEKIRQMCLDGRVTRIETSRGTIEWADQRNGRYQVVLGDIVERTAQDGDEILFNRQPTLHRQSNMGYLTKRSSKLTIGMHSAITTPHNAD